MDERERLELELVLLANDMDRVERRLDEIWCQLVEIEETDETD